MKAALKAGHVVTLPSANTIADGTASKDSRREYIKIRAGKRGSDFDCRGR